MSAYGVTQADLEWAEAAAGKAFILAGFTPEDVCAGLNGVTVYTREGPWVASTASAPGGEPVRGLYHSDSRAIELGMGPISPSGGGLALPHELLHAIDDVRGWGNPGGGHELWSQRHFYAAMDRFWVEFGTGPSCR